MLKKKRKRTNIKTNFSAHLLEPQSNFTFNDFNLRKLLAAFILFCALLMFFSAISQFYSAVDIASRCKTGALPANTCVDLAYKISGTGVVIGEGNFTTRQLLFEFIAVPVAKFFFWAAVLIFSWFLYKADKIKLPFI